MKGSPGPVARRAFRLGTVAAAVLGVAGLGGLHWYGVSLPVLAYLGVVVFPVYMVVAASAINDWLGYGMDAIPHAPVTDPDASAGEGRDDPATHPVRDLIDDPRTHLALVLVSVGVWLVATLAGFRDAAVVSLLFACLVAILWMLRFLWPRLETFFDRRDAARQPTDRTVSLGAVPSEMKTGLSITVLAVLVIALWFLAVRLVG